MLADPLLLFGCFACGLNSLLNGHTRYKEDGKDKAADMVGGWG